MAKSWSGFLPQNLDAKDEWALLEASLTHRANVPYTEFLPEEGEAGTSLREAEDESDPFLKFDQP
jgi:hypothetical protein